MANAPAAQSNGRMAEVPAMPAVDGSVKTAGAGERTGSAPANNGGQ
jgi:hypothetical protein